MSMDAIISALAAAGSNTASERIVALGPSGAGAVGSANAAGSPEANKFAAAIEQAQAASGPTPAELPAPLGNMLRALDGIDVQARSVTDYAQAAQLSGGEMTPGEIVQLTMQCQEFMFQCQLTSNIANRSADGVQQLFRQQS
ncbi:MAG: hypothetical protein AAF291_10445 [Pseudomonadota bacterium]